MPIAALYDIHGNLPALEAVLSEVSVMGADTIVVGGDVVPGPMPAECLACLQDVAAPVLYLSGNGDADVVAIGRGEVVDRVPPAFLDLIGWTAGRLTSEDLTRVGAWPGSRRLEVEGLGRVLFCHATPRSDNEIFTERTPEERLLPVFDGVDADVVVCGHTHMQFDRMVGGVRVVNAGSVGMPFGRPGAFWLGLGPGITFHRTPYDFDAAAHSFATSGYPGAEHFDPRTPSSAEAMLKAFEAAALR